LSSNQVIIRIKGKKIEEIESAKEYLFGERQKKKMSLGNIPDSLLLNIFLGLELNDIYNCSRTCKRWYRVCQDEFLWKKLFLSRYSIEDKQYKSSHSNSWQFEYKRLFYHSPLIESEILEEHTDQVLHVSFSHNGTLFATCSRDGYVRVWSSSYPATCKYSANMKSFNWSYTHFSQFNETDTLLLVSGVHFGDHSSSGEIAVFSLDEFLVRFYLIIFSHLFNPHFLYYFQLQCRVLNKPYDIYGTWYSNEYLLSGRFHYLGLFVSCSALWLNKAYQEAESERKPIVKRLLKFYNKNAGSIRTIMIANSQNDDVDSEVEKVKEKKRRKSRTVINRANSTVNFPSSSLDKRLRSIQTPPVEDQRIDFFGAKSEEACTMQSPIRYSCEYLKKQSNSKVLNKDDLDSDTDNDFDDPPLPWEEEWTNLSEEEQTIAPSLTNGQSFSKIDSHQHQIKKSQHSYEEYDSSESEGRYLATNDKLLIFTTGSLTYTPHQIGIKKIKPFRFQEFITDTPSLSQRLLEKRQQEANKLADMSLNWQDEDSLSQYFDSIDHIIDVKGYIIGMGLSPDHRYLYVNCRSWPDDCIIEHPLDAPPISHRIDMHIIDLKTFKQVGKMLGPHKAYAPNNACFFIFLDVCHQYVASGAEDKYAYLWDRHYGNCLAKLPHNDIVNSVAFNPVDNEVLISVSDDNTIKIWRSRHRMKQLSFKK